MSRSLWRIASDTPDWEAHDLSGKGAEVSGGRWNRPGRRVLYCSNSVALAALETAVHLKADDLPLNRFLVELLVPDAVWQARMHWRAEDLPLGWAARPEGKVSLDLGDAWLAGAASALLELPSAIVPEESNLLINPAHRDAVLIAAHKRRAWFFDARLRR